MDNYKRYTVRQASAILGISGSRVCQLIEAGRLPGAIKAGGTGQWLIPPAALRQVRNRPGPGRPRKVLATV